LKFFYESPDSSGLLWIKIRKLKETNFEFPQNVNPKINPASEIPVFNLEDNNAIYFCGQVYFNKPRLKTGLGKSYLFTRSTG